MEVRVKAMKVMHRDNMIKLLKTLTNIAITENELCALLNIYGDVYFKDPGISPWERTEENRLTKEILGDEYSPLPDKFKKGV